MILYDNAAHIQSTQILSSVFFNVYSFEFIIHSIKNLEPYTKITF